MASLVKIWLFWGLDYMMGIYAVKLDYKGPYTFRSYVGGDVTG